MELYKSKHKIKKIFIFHCIILAVLVILSVYVITGQNSIFGSTTDWLSQHSVIPEYFRQQFYETGDLMPQFSFHLGSGQNAYNFIYHGYLSPITLISYLLPSVSMEAYLVGSTVVVMIAALILFYFWLIKKDISPTAAFFSTLLFLFSSAFMFHAHKQVMFMQYMPFLILALMGADSFIRKKKHAMLCVGVFLMLITNYYFSVAGILAVTVYAVYLYLDTNEKLSAKHFFSTAGSYAVTIVGAGLMSLFSLFPALLAILDGREKDAADAIALSELVTPKLNISAAMYYQYGMGLTCICFVALMAFLLSKKRSRVFLAVTLIVLTCIPLFTYALNIFLYDNTKVYIPFIPVMCFMSASLFEDIRLKRVKLPHVILVSLAVAAVIVLVYIFNGTESISYVAFFVFDMLVTAALLLFCKNGKNMEYLLCFSVVLSCAVSLTVSKTDTLIPIELAEEMYNAENKAFIEECLSDEENFYRSNNLLRTRWSCNYIYSPDFYQTGIYSSVYNKGYNHLTHGGINLSNSTVNDISTVNTNDMLFSKLMGIKYIFAPEDVGVPYGYEKSAVSENLNMYVNRDVYSALFASDRLMSMREFNSLSAAERKFALLGYIVVDDDIPDTYTPTLTELDLKFKLHGEEASLPLDIARNKGFSISASTKKLPYDGYIVEVAIEDLAKVTSKISVNGIENSISSVASAFPKSGKTFSYVVTSPDEINKLKISFNRGGYTVTDIKCYGFSYDIVDALEENIVMSENTKVIGDNTLSGSISVEKDSYINITVPYDGGFKLYVDGVETEYEKTDYAFIGAPVSAGEHEIVLEYHTPGLSAGYIMCAVGLVIFAALLVYDRKKCKNDTEGQQGT